MSERLKRQLALPVALFAVATAVNGHAALVDGEELIDPTAPFLLDMEDTGNQSLANAFASFNNYTVSSILIRENLRIAVINSQRVREGEFIGNARVASIDESAVTLDLDGTTRVLRLHGGAAIKTRAAEEE